MKNTSRNMRDSIPMDMFPPTECMVHMDEDDTNDACSRDDDAYNNRPDEIFS